MPIISIKFAGYLVWILTLKNLKVWLKSILPWLKYSIFFKGIVFYWRTLYSRSASLPNRLNKKTPKLGYTLYNFFCCTSCLIYGSCKPWNTCKGVSSCKRLDLSRSTSRKIDHNALPAEYNYNKWSFSIIVQIGLCGNNRHCFVCVAIYY